MADALRIGYLSLLDPHTRHGASGTNFYMFDALGKAEGVTLHFLGERFYAWPRRLRRLFRSSDRGRSNTPARANAGPRAAPSASSLGLKRRARKLAVDLYVSMIRADIRALALDFIVAPFATTLIAAIGRDSGLPPILFTTDATPRFLDEAYRWDMSQRFTLETEAIRHSARVAYSSDFMAERAREEYAGVLRGAAEKVCVIPFGPNLDVVPGRLPPKARSGSLNLVFVGKDWERKGGPLALAAHRALREAGAPSSLVIIGCDPPGIAGHAAVTTLPHLDKEVAADRARYASILEAAHFLILPTRADCTPMVIAEANAFGTPAIVSDVGGIPSLVTPGRNGQRLALGAPAEAYAAVIREAFADGERYHALSMNSRREYEARLNWRAWAREICRVGCELRRAHPRARPARERGAARSVEASEPARTSATRGPAP